MYLKDTIKNNKTLFVDKGLTMVKYHLLRIPIIVLMLINIFTLPGCGEKSATASNDSVAAEMDTVVPAVPADTIRVLTEDEKLDSVRATLKGYKIVGVVKDHGEKHLVYYKGKTIYAYTTHQPDVAKVQMPYRITDIAVNPKNSHLNVIVDSEPNEHISMKVLFMVYFFETYNDDDDGVFCQLEWEEVGSAQAIEFVNEKAKVHFTTITGQTFDADGNPDFVTEDEITGLY